MSRMGRVPVLGLIVWMLAFPVLSGAQSPEERIPGPVPETPPATAPVMLDGKVLFSVRGVTAYPAETRAKTISERIETIARDGTFSPQALRIVESDEVSGIYAGDRLVVGVFNADARLEGVERPILAQVKRSVIAEAVTAYRRDRSPKVLFDNTMYVFAATALLVVVLSLLRWIFRRLDALIERRVKARLEDLQVVSRRVLDTERILGALQQGLRTLPFVFILVGVFLYLDFALSLYPWTRPFAHRMLSLVLGPLSVMGRAFLVAIPDFVFLAVLAVVTRILLRSVRLLFVAVERGTITISGFDPEWGPPTYKIVRLAIIAFAVVVAYPYIPGSGSGAFKGVTIFLGVLMSLGSSSIIANVIAGYSLIYRRAYRLGDRIRIDDHIGDVVEIRNLVTQLRTPKNEHVVLPNSMILNSHVVNFSSLAKKQGLILHTTVGIGYDTPWRQVEAMLLLAAERTPGLLREPPPFVLATSLGDFAVNYEVNVYCDDPSAMLELYSALHRNILDAFNEYGVQIMSPAYRGDPEQPKIVPRGQWFAPPSKGPSDNEQG